jgi:hypothetical protein
VMQSLEQNYKLCITTTKNIFSLPLTHLYARVYLPHRQAFSTLSDI